MNEVKWIKITTNIFDDEKILLIETMPEHDSIIVIWFKLLALAGKSNNNGIFMLNDKIPYTDEMLASIFRRPLQTVRLALDVFEKFGMIVTLQNVITIPNWEKHQNKDGLDKLREQTRVRVAKCRNKQKELVQKAYIEENVENLENVTLQNVTCSVTDVTSNALEEDKNKNKNKNNIYSSSFEERVEYPQEAKDLTTFLYQSCQEKDTSFKRTEKQLENWTSDFEKIHRIDGREWSQIEAVLKWARSNDFWRKNILSAGKFREKFERLYAGIPISCRGDRLFA